MFCPKCGIENGPRARYCRVCGAGLEAPGAKTETTTPEDLRSKAITEKAAIVDESAGGRTGTEKDNNTQMKKQVEIRCFQSKHAMLFYYLLYFLSVLIISCSAVLLMVGLFAYAHGDKMLNEKISTLTAIFFLIGLIPVSIVIRYAAEKAFVKKKTILSLFPGLLGGVILSEEGLYTAKRVNAKIYYRLHPWKSLSLSSIDEERMSVTLIDGITLLKLRTITFDLEEDDCFNQMKELILKNLSGKHRTVPATRYWVIRGVVLAVFCILIMGYCGASGYLNNASTGKIGDGLCDLCGSSIIALFDWPQGIQITQNGIYVHEYCIPHGFAYVLIHPAVVITSIATVISETARNKDPGYLLNAFEPMYILVILFWMMAIFFIVRLAKWGAATFKQ